MLLKTENIGVQCPILTENCSRTMWYPTCREWLPNGSRNTLLTLGTSIGHQNLQTWTLLSISGLPCNVVFRRDLHHLALLWICGLLCRTKDISRGHATSCCGKSVCLHALPDIRQVYQFFWLFSVVYFPEGKLSWFDCNGLKVGKNWFSLPLGLDPTETRNFT